LGRNIEERLKATTVKERLEAELGVARDIQMGMLPPPDSLPPGFGCRIQGFLQPAKEVGGDFYDFFSAPDGRLAVVIGDVSDKGAPAALFMAMTVTLVRLTIENGLSPAAALTQINGRLVDKNPEGLFVTIFLGLLDVATGEMEYANGGHCPPLVAGGPDGVRRLEDLSGLVLGAWPDQAYTGFKTTLRPGETCLFYTDGVTEAQDSQGAFFGTDRLEEVARAAKGSPPGEMNRLIHEATLVFSGPAQPYDDLTLLSFFFCLAAGNPTAYREAP
jgi:sigma-B regulation protein RsbU (phosphoserine phosphatase)